jgi:hypothetical protein
VWGAFGAGKTQFLFWVAEAALRNGLLPLYFHLNDLLDGISEKLSPEDIRDYAHSFVTKILEALQTDPSSRLLSKTYRDEGLLSYVMGQLSHIDRTADKRPVLLVDEVEQAYISLQDRAPTPADDRALECF